jgi:hypothetical protein
MTKLIGLDRAQWLADKICNGGDYAKEAAIVLVEQARELSAMAEASRWISVKDRLPEPFESVWAWDASRKEGG